jgi:1-deoxy-D-xylulose-5-phosphate synthase
MSSKQYAIGPYLEQINVPSDLREKFRYKDLPGVSDDVRRYLIDVISEIGNSHFGASLGVVEMTVALHYVFNTPEDQLVWDIGHQAYAHKVLTGRKEWFPTNRLKGGMSGFPKRSESEYDTFGVGHSSTSISAALGMAIADNYKGNTERQHIAVIGDGALTAGLAFEGLNHAGSVPDANLLVVLNDNCMSIDPNVGALHEYLRHMNTGGDDIWTSVLRKSELEGNDALVPAKILEAIKGADQTNIFESINFKYFGPIDGHDVIGMAKVMQGLKSVPGPKILHCITRKGAGYKFAEEGNPTQWHAPGVFNKETGEIVKVSTNMPRPPKYQDVFGHTIVELAQQNDRIMGITPAMPTGCSLTYMMEVMPDRTFDVGIAEQHAVTFSAGLATQGMIPFCNIYSTFMQRAYDQVLHDVALQKLHVIFCLDRAGLVGADGATHHGAYDLAFMRSIPNMIVSAPMNESELRNLMFTAQQDNHGPFSIRYPRGRGVATEWKTPMKEVAIGTGRKLNSGTDVAVLTIGHTGNFAQQAIRELKDSGISVAHYDMRFVKPLDEQLLHEVFTGFDDVITVEDGCLMGGFGTAVLEFMSDHKYTANVVRLGIPDAFIEHGTQQELWEECGFDAQGIVRTIQDIAAAKKCKAQLK